MREFIINDWNNGGVIRFVGVILILYFAFSFIFYFAKKVAFRSKKDKNIHAKYERLMFLHQDAGVNFKNVLLKEVPFILLFIVGLVLTIIGLTGSLESATHDTIFIVGLVALGISIIVYVVKFIANGGVKDVSSVWKEGTLKYKDPEYVTVDTYRKWDDEPDSAYRKVDSITYNKNSEENAINFFINLIGYLFKIISIIALALVYLVDCLFHAIKVAIVFFAKPIVKKMAKNKIKSMLDDVAKEGGYIFGNMYVDDSLNELPHKYYEKMVKNCYHNIKNGVKSFTLLSKTDYENCYLCSNVKELTRWTQDGFEVVLYQGRDCRIIVRVPENANVEQGVQFETVPIPLGKVEKYMPNMTEESEKQLVNVARWAEYHYFKWAKENLSPKKRVIYLFGRTEEDGFSWTKTCICRVGDVKLDHENCTYEVEYEAYEQSKPKKQSKWKTMSVFQKIIYVVNAVLGTLIGVVAGVLVIRQFKILPQDISLYIDYLMSLVGPVQVLYIALAGGVILLGILNLIAFPKKKK